MVKFILLIGLTALTGCTSFANVEVKNDPDFSLVEPIELGLDVLNAELMLDKNVNNIIYSAIKTHRENDLITLYLQETKFASKQTTRNQESKKNDKLNFDPMTLLGSVAYPLWFSGIAFTSNVDHRNNLQNRMKVNGMFVTRSYSF